MIVRIYQINLSLDRKRVCFMPYDFIMREHGGVFPNEIYQKVYQAECKTNDPEEVFRQFNLFLPEDYTARSLSVSDVVEFERGPDDRTFYFCEPIGFREISFNRDNVFDPQKNKDKSE